ncbi:MAG: YeeE/YedE thiosulfate transporter family protein, partial [Pirellulaceae bacterium]
PSTWAAAFGPVISLRLVVAFVGGVLMGVGARWAGGCTSGHGISGSLQLAVSSWIAVACFFIGGVVTAMLVFRWIAA